MKSDQEFIDEVYKRARQQKEREQNAAKGATSFLNIFTGITRKQSVFLPLAAVFLLTIIVVSIHGEPNMFREDTSQTGIKQSDERVKKESGTYHKAKSGDPERNRTSQRSKERSVSSVSYEFDGEVISINKKEDEFYVTISVSEDVDLGEEIQAGTEVELKDELNLSDQSWIGKNLCFTVRKEIDTYFIESYKIND